MRNVCVIHIELHRKNIYNGRGNTASPRMSADLEDGEVTDGAKGRHKVEEAGKPWAEADKPASFARAGEDLPHERP